MKRTALLRRTPLRRVSKKRAKESRIYAQKRRQFLIDRPICEVWCSEHHWRWVTPGRYESVTPIAKYSADANYLAVHGAPLSVDVHHKAGRIGNNFLDESTWMAVSREGHDRIHRNPSDARRRGWLV